MPSAQNELRKFLAPEFIFGSGAIDHIPKYLLNFGVSSLFIVTDPGIIKAGITQKIEDLIRESNIPYILFDDVTPNPKVKEVNSGAKLYNESKCNAILAVGGGSVIDCAKGIGITVSNNKNILEFEGVDKVDFPMPPLICIPTTGGTSADVSQFAIINNEDERYKFAIISKAVVPDIALIDPQMLVTMDPYLTACTGIDALVHAIEAYVSNASSPLTDLHAEKAIELVYNNLLPSIAEPDNLEYRNNMMLASLQAGLAFSNASLGAVHAMAHSLGGFLNLPHGECNAMLLNHVINFNFNSSSDRFVKIGSIMDINLKGMTIREQSKSLFNKIQSFKEEAGILETLAGRGIKSSDIKSLAQKAYNDPCVITNPRTPNVRDIEVIYEESL